MKFSPHLVATHVQPFCKDLSNLPLKNISPKFPPNMPLFHQGVFINIIFLRIIYIP